MSKKNFKPIRAFKPGAHVSASGISITFTEEHVREIASSYSAELHQAPIVIGHPIKDTAAALGWIAEATFSETDNHLYLQPRDIVPEFLEANDKGMYERVSVSLYEPTNSNNPVPGKWYLKHLGFLGAQQPAIKGLGNYKFSEADGALEFSVDAEFSEDKTQKNSIAQFASGLTELITRFFGAGKTPIVVDIKEAEKTNPKTEFEESSMNPKKTQEELLAERQADIEQRENAIKAKENSFSEAEQKRKDDDAAEFTEGLVKEGKLLPRLKGPTAAFLANLDDSKELSFAEGEETQTPTELVKSLLSNMTISVDFKERSAADGKKTNSVSYRAPEGETADEAGLEHLARIENYQREHKVSFAEASVAVPREV